MKKRIYWVLLLLSAVGVLCASALTLAVTSQRSMRQAEQYINDLAQSISQSYDYVDEASYEKILQGLPDIVRVTFITSDGTVLYDSNAEASKMENHLDRPEIQQAIHDGFGEDIRNSSTTDSSSYYYALRLSDGNVLRLAQQYSSIRSMMLTSVPGIVVVMVILFGMALLLSHWLTKWMMKPVERAVRALDQAGVECRFLCGAQTVFLAYSGKGSGNSHAERDFGAGAGNSRHHHQQYAGRFAAGIEG